MVPAQRSRLETAEQSPPLTPEEKRTALRQALNSAALARSDRLKNLLRFLCESEVEGRHSDLNEYVIGVEALGQPPGFSPAENSAVRSRVYELRHRLDRLYSTEVPDAPVQIRINKGAYIPTFVRHETGVPEGGAGLQADLAPAPRRPLWVIAGGAFAFGVLLTFVTLHWGLADKDRKHAAAANSLWTPELESIWSPFTDPASPVLVSFESRLLVRIGSVNVRDWTVDEMAKVESSPRLMAIKDLFHQPQLYENRNYADFGTVQAAFEIARLLGSRNPRLKLRRASGIAPDDARDNDLIILSKPSTDPALRQLLAHGPFVDERLQIRNLDPQPGEQHEYVATPDTKDPDHSGERYLLITLMPSLHANRRLLSLASFNSEDPWALAEYLTAPEHARELYSKLRLPNGRMPEYYQVVVKALFRAQSPVHIEYVTHRVLSANVRSSGGSY